MSNGRKLLLADDSLTIQKVVSLTFNDEGFDVTTVGDGLSAMSKIEENAPDIVLADVFMPGQSGYELCERIKSDQRFRDIPVLLLVGTFEPFNEEEARRVGADDVLTKPFQSIRELVNKVNNLLSRKPQRAPEAAAFDDFGMDDEMIQATPVSEQNAAAYAVTEPLAHEAAPMPEVQAHEVAAHEADEHETQYVGEAESPSHEARAEDSFAPEFSAPHAESAETYEPDDAAASADEQPAPMEAQFVSLASYEAAYDDEPVYVIETDEILVFDDARASVEERASAQEESAPAASDVAPAHHEAATAYHDAAAQADEGAQGRQAEVAVSHEVAASHVDAFAHDDALLDLSGEPFAYDPFASEDVILDLEDEEVDLRAPAHAETVTAPASLHVAAHEPSAHEVAAHAVAAHEEVASQETSAHVAPSHEPAFHDEFGAHEDILSVGASDDILSVEFPEESVVEADAYAARHENEAAPFAAEEAHASHAASETHESSAAHVAQPSSDVSPELVEAVARRVVELMSSKVVEDVAWEVVPQLSEAMIRRRLEEGKL